MKMTWWWKEQKCEKTCRKRIDCYDREGEIAGGKGVFGVGCGVAEGAEYMQGCHS